jgi:hypothetical protein
MKSRNKRILSLEKEVLDLKTTLAGFMDFVGYEGKQYVPLKKLNIEPIEVLQNKLKETELDFN